MGCTNLKPLVKLSKLKTLRISFLHSQHRTESKIMIKLRDFLRLPEPKHIEKAISLRPIKKLVNLEELVLRATKIKNIEVVSGLKNLRELEISGMDKDIPLSILSEITSIKTLKIEGKNISNLASLKSLSNLESLYIISKSIYDANIFADFTNLKSLSLYDLNIKDISPLIKLTNLESLSLNNLPIEDLTLLNKFENLKSLTLTHIKISDISPIDELQNLNTLVLGGLDVKDIKPLISLKNLRQLDLWRQSISEDQIVELKNALPNLEIILKPVDIKIDWETAFD